MYVVGSGASDDIIHPFVGSTGVEAPRVYRVDCDFARQSEVTHLSCVHVVVLWACSHGCRCRDAR